MIGKTISQYRIIEQLGAGGMGVVYKAEDTKLKRTVALKFLPPELTRDADAKARFIREAQAASALEHPNICNIHEIGETDDGQMFIVMACYEGQTLKEKIADGSLSVDEAINIAIQIVQGLSRAHEEGIVHRDIKPANIIITDRGEVKILDFGLAKLSGQAQLTKNSSTLGTVAYMSPEQLSGKEVDQRTDIWSLGVVLYEMLTGELPFMGDYEQAIVYAILNEELQIENKFDFAYGKLIEKCLEKDSHQRFPTIKQLIDELTGVGEESPTQLKDEPSIVVLPFDDISPNKDNEYFSDGLTEEIIADLSQIKSLKVISRTSSMVLKGTTKNMHQISKELDVQYVLEGSVRKAGEQVRITAQLIDAARDAHLWAEKYNGNLNDVFELQERVSKEIVTALKLSVTGGEERKIEKRYTDNVEAYNLYLKGLHLRRRLIENDIYESIKYFKEAIELDPDYALAYAGIAYAYFLLPFYTSVNSSEIYSDAKNAVQNALDLDDQLPEAYEALSLISGYIDWDWVAGKQAAKKMIELNPGYPWGYFHLSAAYSVHGQVDKTIQLLKKAHRLDPLNMAFNRNLGYAYLSARQPEIAIEYAHRTLKMNDQAPGTHLLLAKAYLTMGNYSEALASINREKGQPQEIIDPLRGIIYAHIERREDAFKIFEKYLGQPEDDFYRFYSLAALAIALGKTEQALDLLDKAFEIHDVEMHRIKTDFLFDSIRTEARFKALLKKMKLD